MSLFTEKEIQEVNQKSADKLRWDVADEIKKRMKPDQKLDADEAAKLFLVIYAKLVWIPDGNKIGIIKS